MDLKLLHKVSTVVENKLFILIFFRNNLKFTSLDIIYEQIVDKVFNNNYPWESHIELVYYNKKEEFDKFHYISKNFQ